MDTSVPAWIGAECLAELHRRAVEQKEEWGARIRPTATPDSPACVMGCSAAALIRGTRAQPSKLHSRLHGRPMLSAITPLHDEVLTTTPSCSKGVLLSVVAHTHPRALYQWRLAPPSASDMAAHLVLANTTNWRRNRQINTMLLVAPEGLYHYWILPTKVAEHLRRIDALCAASGAEAVEQLRVSGEPPVAVLGQLRDEVLADIMPGYHALEREMLDHEAMLRRPKGHERAIRAFIEDNALTRHLAGRGMGYDFYPAPFDRPVKIEAAATVRRSG